MNRRQSLKAITITSLLTGLIFDSCKTKDNKDEIKELKQVNESGREDVEVKRNEKLKAEIFFNQHEMKTITVLADIIIPKDDISGNASDAKVPDFIEFIVKDKPDHQLPMRGGLIWIDFQCYKYYNRSFIELSHKDQLSFVRQIAYPDKAKAEMMPGVHFFNRMRDLTASGFYTTKMGIEDIGYKGNSPNVWKGVPEEELERYGLVL